MPVPVPTADDLAAQIKTDQMVRIPGADVNARFNTLGILAAVWARSLALIWGWLGRYWARQFFADSAETIYLERRAAPFGVFRDPPGRAAGNFTIGGTDGIPIPAGTVLTTRDGSFHYRFVNGGTVASGTLTDAIIASAGGVNFQGGGDGGNQNAGAVLSLYSGIAGIAPAGTVAVGGLTGGTDSEPDESLRARLIARQSQPPHGGAWFDYVAWARLVAGVTRVWVFPLRRGLGTVDVTFVMDGRTNNVPLSGDLTAVTSAINTGAPNLGARPVTADVVVFAPATSAWAVTISAMTPNDAGTHADVTAQLNALARRIAPGGAQFGDGVSTMTPGGTLYLEDVYGAIRAVGTIANFDLSAPPADLIFGGGTIPALPTISFP